ncbi:MAG: amidohydrolase [Desulfocapsaceae bacterium]|nr:amidohydrolase [Desulfocapsaceae bacterium]
MPDTLQITDCTILPEAGAPLISPGFLEITDNTIRTLGPMEQRPAPGTATVIKAPGQLLMPGLINSHNHCAMTLFRGLADDLDLMTWLNRHIFPAEAASVNPEMVYWCTRLAAAEMLLAGTTTVADGYFHADSAARACRDAGIRAVAAQGVIDFPAPGVPDPSRNIEMLERFIDFWLGQDPLVTPAVFAHSPYTCSPATLLRAKETADRHRLRFFIHLAEARGEAGMLIDARGTSPVKHLQTLGLLDAAAVCVHSIWLDDADLDILAATGAQVVSCPQSNLKLASGTARVSAMLDRGIRVGLGTDGCASNNSLDMFREMDMLAKIQKLKDHDATSLPARQALACATTDGARLLGLPQTGRLVAGGLADMVLIDLQAPHLTPFYNQDLLVYAARGSDVRTVIVDGRIVVRDRKVLAFDLEETLAAVERLAAGLRAA